jgi:hypothetical protein
MQSLDQENIILESFLHTYYQDMSDRNWQAYSAHFWKNATMSTIWTPEQGINENVDIFTIEVFLSKTGEGPDSQPIFEETMETVEIEVKGNLATAWVKYHAKFGTEEELMEWTGTDLFSLMKHNNHWKIVNLSYAAE